MLNCVETDGEIGHKLALQHRHERGEMARPPSWIRISFDVTSSGFFDPLGCMLDRLEGAMDHRDRQPDDSLD